MEITIQVHPKGFKFIECSASLFSVKLNSPCICDRCNGSLLGGVIYVGALNWGICKECWSEFIEEATYYPEDSKIEEANISYHLNKLTT